MSDNYLLNHQEIYDILGEKHRNLSLIVSDKFGIVNAILSRKELDKYNLFMYQCLSANIKKLINVDRDISSGGLGVNEDKKSALIGCIAEAIERYCISFYDDDDLLYCRKDDLSANEILIPYNLYSNYQYKQNVNFANPNTDFIHWDKVFSVTSPSVWKYYPASLIYMPFQSSKIVAETTSTGLAAGFRLEDCILSGLLELIERDAIMINFAQRLNPVEINLDSFKKDNRKFIDNIKEEYNVKIYKLYSDIDVPIYCSIIWNKWKGKIHYGIGACANLDSDIAVNKSLKESLFTYFYSKNIMDLKTNNLSKIKTLYEHFLYYQGDNFNKLLFDSKIIDYVRNITSYEQLLASLNKNKIQIYYKELTTEDVFDTKLRVVRVVTDQLIDINKNHSLARLGASRFWDVPKKLGLKCDETLSYLPHPFP